MPRTSALARAGNAHDPSPLFPDFTTLPRRLDPSSSTDHGAEITCRLSHHEGCFPSLTFSSGALTMTPLRRRMIDDMTLHGLKPKTIKAYVPCVARFARYFGKSPTLLGTPEIRAYLLYLTHEKHVSASTYNQYLCALKFLYRITLRREWGLDGLARTRRQTKLPVVLSLEEVTRFLQAVTSIRHRAILMTAYAAGLRISEVLALRVGDIDSQRMVIRIDQGKGSKDRYVMLSPRLLTLLRDYCRARRRRKVYQPSPWLFPGNVPGRPLTAKPVYEACEAACLAAGLGKHVTVRTLRHSRG